MRVLYQPHGDLFGARALSGKRFSGGEQLLCLCLSWDAVGVGYQGGGSVSPSGVLVRGDRLVFGICLCGDRDRTRFVWRDEAVCPFLFIADYWWTIVLITKMACLRNSLIRGFLLGMGAFR